MFEKLAEKINDKMMENVNMASMFTPQPQAAPPFAGGSQQANPGNRGGGGGRGQGRGGFRGQCFNCKEFGHFSDNCPHPSKDQVIQELRAQVQQQQQAGGYAVGYGAMHPAALPGAMLPPMHPPPPPTGPMPMLMPPSAPPTPSMNAANFAGQPNMPNMNMNMLVPATQAAIVTTAAAQGGAITPSSAQAVLAEPDARVATLSTEVADLTSRITEMESAHAATQRSLGQLAKEAGTTSNRVLGMATTLGEQARAIESNSTRQATMNAKTDRLEALLRSSASKQQDMLGQLTTQVTALAGRVTEFSSLLPTSGRLPAPAAQ